MNYNKFIVLCVLIVCAFFGGLAYLQAVINKNNEPGFAEAIAQPAPVEKPPLTPTRKVKIKDNSTLYEQSKFKQIKEGLGNDDVIGYLKIDGTTIDYPVLQSSDNKYYLNRDEYGQASAAGSIFLDYENDIRRSDKNTIIYGHNMNKDYMFHSLRYYNDYDYYLKHKYITFDTLYANQTWEIFSFYKTDISFNYIKVFFSSQEEFIDLLSEMKSRSVYDTGVDVAPDDLVLTLSTCSNQETDTRFVVNAKLVSQTLYTPLSQN